jgi:hypothetical protein
MDEGFNLEDVNEHGSYIKKDDEKEKYCVPLGEGIGPNGEENITIARKCPQRISICASLDLQVMFMTLNMCMDGCLLGACRCCAHFMDVGEMGKGGLEVWGSVATMLEKFQLMLGTFIGILSCAICTLTNCCLGCILMDNIGVVKLVVALNYPSMGC